MTICVICANEVKTIPGVEFDACPACVASQNLPSEAIKQSLLANGYSEINTGGGCTAWSKNGEGEFAGLYVLITDEVDNQLSFTKERVCIGLYDDRTGIPHLNFPVIANLREAGIVADAMLGFGVHDGFDIQS